MPMPKDLPSSPQQHDDWKPSSSTSKSSQSSSGHTNAAAESLNSLYKKELIEREGPWRGTDDVMLATLEWVDWYNTERLHSACKYIPPKEYEENYYAQQERMVS
jgi:transposase InsO family protein